MRIFVVTILVLFSFSVFSQNKGAVTLGNPSSNNPYGCDTTTQTPVVIEFTGSLMECYEMQGGVSVKRANCDNIVFGSCNNLPTAFCDGSGWLLISKCEIADNLCNTPNPFPGIVQVASRIQGTHPEGAMLGQDITNWSAFAICSDTLPGVDGNGHYWISGNIDDFSSITSYTRVDADPICSEEHLSTVGCNDGRRDDLLQSLLDTMFSTETRISCFKGVQKNVTIGYDAGGNIIWYKDELGNDIISPDFNSVCPPLSCESQSQTLCVDGAIGTFADNEELIVVFQNCNDGSSSITGAARLSNPTVSVLPLPSGIQFQGCSNDIETELIGCVEDEKGVRWNVILIDGITIAYQNQADNSFGTPSGSALPCQEETTTVSVISGKYCIAVGTDTLEAFLFAQDDKTICAKQIGGTVVYNEDDYNLVSCCPESNITTTTHLAGFTANRPTDTPNTGWNNELTAGSAALTGDFELCFTPTASGASPQMIGLNSDPNTNASYTSIDCALYLYTTGTTWQIREYRNAVSIGQLSTANWSNQEICFERIGSVLTYKLNGANIGNCPIGAGTVFLDDSHYFAAGFWGTGQLSYSDFILKSGETDLKIRSVEDCEKCCDSGGGSINVTTNDLGILFAYGQQDLNTSGQLFNSTIARTAVGRYTVTFGQAHPDGADYAVTFGGDEPANTRDVPKISLVDGTRTANGFRVQVTVDDNGGAADPYVDEEWSFMVAINQTVVTNVTSN